MTEANERYAQEHATNVISEETQDMGNGKQQGNGRNPVEHAQSTDSEIRQVTTEEELLSDGCQDARREEREGRERRASVEKHAHANNEQRNETQEPASQPLAAIGTLLFIAPKETMCWKHRFQDEKKGNPKQKSNHLPLSLCITTQERRDREDATEQRRKHGDNRHSEQIQKEHNDPIDPLKNKQIGSLATQVVDSLLSCTAYVTHREIPSKETRTDSTP